MFDVLRPFGSADKEGGGRGQFRRMLPQEEPVASSFGAPFSVIGNDSVHGAVAGTSETEFWETGPAK